MRSASKQDMLMLEAYFRADKHKFDLFLWNGLKKLHKPQKLRGTAAPGSDCLNVSGQALFVEDFTEQQTVAKDKK